MFQSFFNPLPTAFRYDRFSNAKKMTLYQKFIYLHVMPIYMSEKVINRLKVVLVEQRKTNKWLVEQLNKNETTVSRWCPNAV